MIKAEEFANPWQGDWKDRLNKKLRELNYSSLGDFLEAHPGISYTRLAGMLNDANIAAIQLYAEYIMTASRDGKLRKAARDSLVRFLNEHLKHGWAQGIHFEYRLASAFSDWKDSIIRFSLEGERISQTLDEVWRALKSSPPPAKWIPDSPEDQNITAAFAEGWPKK